MAWQLGRPAWGRAPSVLSCFSMCGTAKKKREKRFGFNIQSQQEQQQLAKLVFRPLLLLLPKSQESKERRPRGICRPSRFVCCCFFARFPAFSVTKMLKEKSESMKSRNVDFSLFIERKDRAALSYTPIIVKGVIIYVTRTDF